MTQPSPDPQGRHPPARAPRAPKADSARSGAPRRRSSWQSDRSQRGTCAVGSDSPVDPVAVYGVLVVA